MGVFGKGIGILLWSRKFKNERKGPQYLSKLVLNKLVFNPLNASCLASSACRWAVFELIGGEAKLFAPASAFGSSEDCLKRGFSEPAPKSWAQKTVLGLCSVEKEALNKYLRTKVISDSVLVRVL